MTMKNSVIMTVVLFFSLTSEASCQKDWDGLPTYETDPRVCTKTTSDSLLIKTPNQTFEWQYQDLQNLISERVEHLQKNLADPLQAEDWCSTSTELILSIPPLDPDSSSLRIVITNGKESIIQPVGLTQLKEEYRSWDHLLVGDSKRPYPQGTAIEAGKVLVSPSDPAQRTTMSEKLAKLAGVRAVEFVDNRALLVSVPYFEESLFVRKISSLFQGVYDAQISKNSWFEWIADKEVLWTLTSDCLERNF